MRNVDPSLLGVEFCNTLSGKADHLCFRISRAFGPNADVLVGNRRAHVTIEPVSVEDT